MAHYITEEAKLINPSLTSNFELLENLLHSKKRSFDFSDEEWMNVEKTLHAIGDGDFITAEIAEIKKFIFAIHNKKTPVNYRVTKSEIIKFLDKTFEIPKSEGIKWDEYDLAFRFYMGKDGDSYNIVIVPIISPKTADETDTRDHTKDLEKTMFSSTGLKFFALNLKSGQIDFSDTDCEKLIKSTDISTVKLAFYSYERLNEFIRGVADADFTHLVLEFAREDIHANSKLSLVLTCEGSNGPLTSTLTSGNGVKASGINFDRSDLIPPPPKTILGTQIHDSHFTQIP